VFYPHVFNEAVIHSPEKGCEKQP